MKKIAPAIALLAAVVLSGCSAPAATGATVTGKTTGGETPTAAAAPSATAAAKPSGDWYTATWGTFAPLTKTGTSDAVIDLPPGAVTGIVTASYTGAGNFIIQGLDPHNQETLDVPVNAVGNYTGVTRYGFSTFGSQTASFRVTGTGKWTVTIAPVNTVAALPGSGTGDGVYRYDGPAKSWTVTHKGSGVFQVEQYTKDSTTSGFDINQVGDYSGTVSGLAGPSLVEIHADGPWTLK